ncbi:hypothetical protein [Paractinoplanes hotanensis]|uniref:Uncharacterized protein n=1 Tax=Paractinoplanes hotanensis TaxID=2906497 RepID=A0ABT0YDL5_9ACTN|nr:hypothetical protein [Actinoplanes hotanensis]MCM4083582.1 hypothetical protein [Actinoplanes hotanensis]
MAPGSPGGGPQGGSGSGVPDRPDAAGLVEGDVADWQLDGVEGPDVPTGGVAAGGSGLDTAGAGFEVAPTATPMMMSALPEGGPPGSPAGSDSKSGRPDAAGLVCGDGGEWDRGDPAGDVPQVAEPPLAVPVPSGSAPGQTAPGDRPAAPAKGGESRSPGKQELEQGPPPAAEPVPVAAAEPVLTQSEGWAEPSPGVGTRAPAVPVMPLTPVADAEEEPAVASSQAAELLAETAEAWAAGGPWAEATPVAPADDVVPVLDLEHVEEDPAAWGDTDGSWLLEDGPRPHEDPTNRS